MVATERHLWELPHTVVARLQASPGLPGYELPLIVVTGWLQASPGLPGYELPHAVVAGLQASPGLPGYELPHTVVTRIRALTYCGRQVKGLHILWSPGYRPHQAFLVMSSHILWSPGYRPH